MKQFRIILTAALFIVFSMGTAAAVPQYYLFEGTIRDIRGDNRDIAASQGFKVGDKVEYLFMLDTFVMGQVVFTNGEVLYDTNDVYAELVSGSILKEQDGGYYIRDKGASVGNNSGGCFSRELHLANMGSRNQKRILTGNEDETVIINANANGSWNGYLHAYDSKGRRATVYLDLRLTSITNVLPFKFKSTSRKIPEPATMAFIGLLLIGGAGLIHRKRRRNNPHGALPVSGI